MQPSVFTVGSAFGLGSGWVVKSDGATSLLVTNYHVVQAVVERGGKPVTLLATPLDLSGMQKIAAAAGEDDEDGEGDEGDEGKEGPEKAPAPAK